MKLADKRYEDIKQEVANMFIDYDIKCVPVNSFEVATKIGLTVIPYSALNDYLRKKALYYSEDGFSLQYNPGEWRIYYNDNMKFTRINQTIMHEVGHYILGHSKEGDEEETEAKFFAKYALASPVLIHNMKVEKTIENVMSNFDIGYIAAGYALNYYEKWLRYGAPDYLIYERQILGQLEIDRSWREGVGEIS